MNFTQNVIASLQTRLAGLGYYRLKIDGEPGSGTSNAVIAFKEVHGLRARDLAGPLTMARLFSSSAQARPEPKPIEGEPLWLTEARSLLGTREVPGAANNPEIMKWAIDLEQWYPGDDVPWCGLFMAHCMTVGAPNEPQDFNRLGARNWLEYGEKAGGVDAPLGGVGVLWRTHPTKSWNGHVIVITGQNNTHIRGIGGNQSDNVSELWFSRSRFLGVRMPAGVGLPLAPFANTGTLSTNEA